MDDKPQSPCAVFSVSAGGHNFHVRLIGPAGINSKALCGYEPSSPNTRLQHKPRAGWSHTTTVLPPFYNLCPACVTRAGLSPNVAADCAAIRYGEAAVITLRALAHEKEH